jgi:hypothetical protein
MAPIGKPFLVIGQVYPQVKRLAEAVAHFIDNYQEDLGGRSRSFEAMVNALKGDPNEIERSDLHSSEVQ